ncbi:cytochrome P450 [Nocardioides taihuensis]|uniref:Cytochrome P450 n=1 Tax=Nocardioides taihuensis TaxID=1835606 RepID=A0ABW0BK18_9ACTN
MDEPTAGPRVEPADAHARTGEDRRADHDDLRARCPVARDGDRWMVLGHREVASAATDPATYSSAVTARRAIPNSLDGDEHHAYRALVDRYLTPERVADLEPQARAGAAQIVEALPRGVTVKTIAQIGLPFAVRTQSTWLGWPSDLEPTLVAWIHENQAATRSGDRRRTAAVAEQFDQIVRSLLDARRCGPARDLTGELMRETIHGRALKDDETVSILRNWTAGDLGSLAMSVGVIVHFLAARPAVQSEVRELVLAHDTRAVEAALEEILRIDDPFVSNRRRATAATRLGGEQVEAGALVVLNWTAANRDPRVFDDPDGYDPAANAEANLVFGIGPHACPGRALTLMELRVLTTELLRATTSIDPAPDRPAVREAQSVGGWARVPVVLR